MLELLLTCLDQKFGVAVSDHVLDQDFECVRVCSVEAYFGELGFDHGINLEAYLALDLKV